MRIVILGGLLVSLAAQAGAERRWAVVVGNNRSRANATVLRFAESDAGKFARTFTELGSVRPEDVSLVLGRSPAEVEHALQSVRARIAEHRKVSSGPATLLFYFAGHSDGASLEMGEDRLALSRLRALLTEANADLRIAVVDACQSGTAVRKRALKTVAPFELNLFDELQTRGEVFISSSAENESALESDELGGGVFTQALVSGLRGAADRSGDGRVTLAEAYDYAFSRTVMQSSESLQGIQHPSYKMELSGTGELVLTQWGARTAGLIPPREFERFVVMDLTRGQVAAELMRGSGEELALASGAYGVFAQRGPERFRGRISLAEGERRRVEWGELHAVSGQGSLRGQLAVSTVHRLFLSANLAATVTRPLGPMPSLSLLWYVGESEGWNVGLDLGCAGGSVAEYASSARVGYRWERPWWRLSFGLGGAFSAGVRWQRQDATTAGLTPVASLSPVGSVRTQLVGPLEVLFEARPGVSVMKLDGRFQARFTPEAGLGLGLRW